MLCKATAANTRRKLLRRKGAAVQKGAERQGAGERTIPQSNGSGGGF